MPNYGKFSGTTFLSIKSNRSVSDMQGKFSGTTFLSIKSNSSVSNIQGKFSGTTFLSIKSNSSVSNIQGKFSALLSSLLRVIALSLKCRVNYPSQVFSLLKVKAPLYTG